MSDVGGAGSFSWGGAIDTFSTLAGSIGSSYFGAKTAEAKAQADASNAALVANSQVFQAGLSAQTWQILGIATVAMIGLVLVLRLARKS